MARRGLRGIGSFVPDMDVEDSNYRSNKCDMFDTETNKTVQFREILELNACIRKNGFSKKTLKFSSRRNLKIKSDLGINDLELVILVPFMVQSDSIMTARGLASYGRADSTIILLLYKALFKLYVRGLLSTEGKDSDVTFHVSADCYNYCQTGEFKVKDEKNSLKDVIREIDKLANLYNNRIEQVSDMGENAILMILNRNKDLPFCSELLDLYAQNSSETVEVYKFCFYIIGHLILNKNQMDRDCALTDRFYQFNKERAVIIAEVFSNEENLLFRMKILQRGIDESGKADKNRIEIHSDFKRKYLMGIMREKKLDDVIEKDKIADKRMFFNEENEKQIKDLRSILETEKLEEVRSRLLESGSKGGFTCLFMGHPGTGKTEAALQIAKETGRDIIKVDMSALRSKWWGEDEKNVKAIFTNYKSAMKEARIEPILLLNEADAIIGKRLDVTGTNGALLTSINATQNIILDEMENFEGIMIATTNLTENMDCAFERRFLYKIDFEKPDRKTRAKLYESILGIPSEDAELLSREFDLTGGQIENVKKKKVINYVLRNENSGLDALRELCRAEKINENKPIGFGA